MDKKFAFNGIEFTWKEPTLKYYAESKRLLMKYQKFEDSETKGQKEELLKIEGVSELLSEIDSTKNFLNEIIEKSREKKEPGIQLLNACYQLGKEIETCKALFMLNNTHKILKVCLEPESELEKINYLSIEKTYVESLIEFGEEVFNFFLSKHNESTMTLEKLLNTLADIKFPESPI